MNKTQWRIRQWLSRLHPLMRENITSAYLTLPHEGDIAFGRYSMTDGGPLLDVEPSTVWGFFPEGDFDKFVRWASLWYFRDIAERINYDHRHTNLSNLFANDGHLLDYPPFVEWWLNDG